MTTFQSRVTRSLEICRNKDNYLESAVNRDVKELRHDLTCLTSHVLGKVEDCFSIAENIRSALIDIIKSKC